MMQMFNHVGLFNSFCVVMRCLEIDMGSYYEIIFGLLFNVNLPRAHQDTNMTDRDKTIKVFDV